MAKTPKYLSFHAPADVLDDLQKLAFDHSDQNWTINEDPQQLHERWAEMARRLSALRRDWLELSQESSNRAYGRIYGTVGDDGIKRYRVFDRNGNETTITIPR